MHLHSLGKVSLAAALCACASTPKVESAPVHDPTAIAIAAAVMSRWTGNLQPTQSHTGAVKATERQRAYGSVELIVPRDRPTRTRVRLNVSVPTSTQVNTLRWGIYPGNCGSGSPPVVPAEVFPIIDLSSNGQGSIDQEIAIEMPNDGRYHVNVLMGTGTQLSNVLTCGNLRKVS